MTVVPAGPVCTVAVVTSGVDAVSAWPDVDVSSVTVDWVPATGETVVRVCFSVVGPKVIVSASVDTGVAVEMTAASVDVPSEADKSVIIACVAALAVDVAVS